MSDRFNTFAGWLLFAGIVALGLSSVSTRYFSADKVHRPEEMAYMPVEVAAEGPGAAGPSFMALLATADPAAGERVFAKCQACHTIAQGGANGIGPNLFGVVGTAIGAHAPGFAYTAALSGHGGSWSFENLDQWLTNPRGFADGTSMSFAGLPKVEDRANLVAYLNSMGSNLPLPEVVEEAPAEEEAAIEGEAAAVEEAPAEEAAAE
ncbi:MAG TPA: cytochrome c family protein [Sphingomonadaceae bacterium]|nr:cytochrome c family protein [Sphingomonadaceae bacterium]